MIRAPFPYFGGKSSVAHLIWERLGPVPNYVEPFLGSAAVLLARPDEPHTETVNDACGFISNFWRAIKANSQEVARFADWPVNENDLHARHIWLVERKYSLAEKLEGDPDYFDAKVAGWWVWGICCWIGGGFCSGSGPWQIEEVEGVRKLVHAGDAGRGVNRQRVQAGDAGRGVNSQRHELASWFGQLAQRLRRVRVCCGDWSRIIGPSVTTIRGLTGVFLDPPYSDEAGRASSLYAKDCGKVAHECREWAIANGNDPLLRICLCGYEREHVMPSNWQCVPWKTKGGFGSQKKSDGRKNCEQERLWFSPNCLKPEFDLFREPEAQQPK